MSNGFKWTPTRDQQLREFKRNGFTIAETARAMCCATDDVVERRRALRAIDASNSPAIAAVPRPVGVTPRRQLKRDTKEACGTAREAPTGSLLGDPPRDIVDASPDEEVASALPPQLIRRPLIDLSKAPSAMETRFARGPS